LAKDQLSQLVIAPETPDDAAAAMSLVDRSFGPGRYAKAAERLREGNHFAPQLSFVARENGVVVGTVRLWPVRIGERAALLLGPIAVDSAARRRGLGAALAERACAAAGDAGHEVVVLVGDLGFFERMGFQRPPAGSITLPGPADPQRILVRALKPDGLEGLQGQLSLP
jgi:predicted N-acetyltransferase YhbS